MRPTVTDGLVYSLSVAIVSPAKTSEPIEMMFGLWTRAGPRNHVLDEVPDPTRRGNFEAKGAPHCIKYRTFCRELCKMAEQIEMPFGVWTRVGSRKHVLDRNAQWRN